MKKSERFYLAMLAVADCERMRAEDKIEVIENLMAEKSVAEWCEKTEDKSE